MKNLETTILINRSAQTVWNILLDFPQYSQWNPFIKSIQGEAQVGQQLTVLIQPPGQKAQQFTPVVQVCDPAREFRWLGHLFVKGLFDGEHYFILEPINDRQVRLRHGEHFSGLLVRPIMALIGASTLQGFTAMNEALKQRAEAQTKS